MPYKCFIYISMGPNIYIYLYIYIYIYSVVINIATPVRDCIRWFNVIQHGINLKMLNVLFMASVHQWCQEFENGSPHKVTGLL